MLQKLRLLEVSLGPMDGLGEVWSPCVWLWVDMPLLPQLWLINPIVLLQTLHLNADPGPEAWATRAEGKERLVRVRYPTECEREATHLK